MANRPVGRKARKAIEDVKSRQRNIVFPEVLRNSRFVYAFLWKGSADAPFVQRVGAWIFGSFFILVVLAILGLGLQKRSWQADLFSVLWFLLGGKIFLNGCRRSRVKNSNHK